MKFSPEMVSALIGIGISLVCSFFPGMKTEWESLSTEKKRIIMAGLVLVASAGVWVAECQPWTGATCNQAELEEFIKVFVAALVANQGTFMLTKG